MSLKNVTLEMSLKPFKDPAEPAVRAVCRHLFEQWKPLLGEADGLSVMLWSSDGSEILDYAGDLDAPFEWARYIGHANPPGVAHFKPAAGSPAAPSPEPNRLVSPNDPKGINLHSRNYLYMENPPTFTYGWLKRLLGILKEVGTEITGKPVRVGATFDPGPEFAKSSFKYQRHPEICLGGTMGKATFVGCYATLHADDHVYAGYPKGIPEGTSFGAFLGRQSQHFLTDIGFDYIWFSNGFGFGIETWGYLGPLFDGKEFKTDRVPEIREKSLAFWNDFRRECPDFLIETRGTNLSTGMDLSSDAVPLREIYRGGYNLTAPPNSPWAAIDGDFGLELVGWMSHIAELPPEETFPFRFYTHDPWWLNSPWLDRYGREPHDIYLPLAISRLNEAGTVQTPSTINILTADDSYGTSRSGAPGDAPPHPGRSPGRPGSGRTVGLGLSVRRISRPDLRSFAPAGRSVLRRLVHARCGEPGLSPQHRDQHNGFRRRLENESRGFPRIHPGGAHGGAGRSRPDGAGRGRPPGRSPDALRTDRASGQGCARMDRGSAGCADGRRLPVRKRSRIGRSAPCGLSHVAAP
ncbi:MAG: hypothetical protein U1E27_06010 [Kiritimatiellia bacterium]|nr:hypothetical protein [Kiritimatiellia bacterium]